MVKRILDVTLALIFLVLLFPVMVVVGVLVLISLGRPIFFVQQRPGLDGEPFNIFKFRTMSERRPRTGDCSDDAGRLGPVGSFLRRSSLDELPEVINILRGDMSFIGPRPLLMDYLPLYSERQARRHNVKPGLTGWAQINGRNNLSWKDKFELDVWYVDNRSLALDLKILLMTVGKVLMREDVSQEGHATAEHFKGNSL